MAKSLFFRRVPSNITHPTLAGLRSKCSSTTRLACRVPSSDAAVCRFSMEVISNRRLESASFNVKHLTEEVRARKDIVVPGPTCSYMIKKEYPELLGTDEARLVAERTYDLCEYLVKKAREGKLDRTFKKKPGKVAYQAACHLRAQNIGFKSRDLMKAAGAEVELIERCSAVDGTWGFKKEFSISCR